MVFGYWRKRNTTNFIRQNETPSYPHFSSTSISSMQISYCKITWNWDLKAWENKPTFIALQTTLIYIQKQELLISYYAVIYIPYVFKHLSLPMLQLTIAKFSWSTRLIDRIYIIKKMNLKLYYTTTKIPIFYCITFLILFLISIFFIFNVLNHQLNFFASFTMFSIHNHAILWNFLGRGVERWHPSFPSHFSLN